MQLFRLMPNTFKSFKLRGSYVYRQMWQQEICALPAEIVCKVSTVLIMRILFLVFRRSRLHYLAI
jgi:hypothetical protein